MNKPKRILIVDDDESSRNLLETLTEAFGYESELAQDGFEALAKLKLDIDLVLLDVNMPGLDGFEVARRMRAAAMAEELPIIMVTCLSSKQDRLRAIEAGANDFIAKPVDQTELMVRMKPLLKMKDAQDQIKRYHLELEQKIQERTGSLRQALEDMAKAQRVAQHAHLETIHRLALAAEYKDGFTAAHIHRVSHYCAALSRGLRLPPGDVEIIFHASPMHDVGKIGVPETILLKQGPLTPEEWAIMKNHTLIGARILSGSSSVVLKTGELIAMSHHEKWDGRGYPNEIAGEDIPIFGRITAVADVFDALTTQRPYKKAFPNRQAYEILHEGRGKHFDPQIIDVFFEKIGEIETIQKKYGDERPGRELAPKTTREPEPALAAV